MIEQKDYIMMQIEQISRLLAQLFRQLENRKMFQARATVENCFSVLNLDRETIRTCDPNEIADGIADPRLLVQLADLLSVCVRLFPDDHALRLHRAVTARLEEEMVFQWSL